MASENSQHSRQNTEGWFQQLFQNVVAQVVAGVLTVAILSFLVYATGVVPHLVQCHNLSCPPSPPTVTSSHLLHIGVVSYFDPGSQWDQIEMGYPQVGLAIINPNSGPGMGKDPTFLAQVLHTQKVGIKVLGYVHTSYAGSQNHSRALSDVEADIDNYYAWYPRIDGIFVDEVTTDCKYVDLYYKPLFDYIRNKDAKAQIVLDPGTATAECYMAVGDIIVDYDDLAVNYTAWESSGWELHYPASRFWHIIHNASQTDLPHILTLAKSRNVGWIYATDLNGSDANGPATFSMLPTYWSLEIDLVKSSH
jgi:hypothetical protein